MSNRHLTRRNFLKFAGLSSAAVGIGAAGGAASASRSSQTPGGINGWPSQQVTAEEMDKFHEEGVKYFLANIGKDKEFWSAELPFRMDGNTKVFDIECSEGDWEVQPGQTINAMMYNKRVPGPIMRATQGDNVKINVTNKMTQSTGVHFHGIHTPNSQDGVPFVTQPPIKPGTTFTYEFRVPNTGSHMYHSHHNAAEQVTRGLFGAFIVDPQDKSKEPKVDADYVMVLNDAGIGMTINGKSFPATQPIVAKKGQRLRIRYMNEGLQIHPMHLHGMYQQVIAKDGSPVPLPYLVDTLTVGPGERYDVLVDCQEPGAWAFHCHILSHAESSHGMFGMVTALVIQA